MADAALASSLRISVSRLARRLRAQRSDDSLSPSQLGALTTLATHGPMAPSALAEHEKVQPPSMTRIIAALESQGMVTRSVHPFDRRQAVVAVTDAGRGRIRADQRRREAWLSCRLAELSPEDRAVLRAAAPVLDRLGQS